MSPAPRDAWRALVAASGEAVVYQTPEWVDACCLAGGYHDRSRLYEMPDGRCLLLPLLSSSSWPRATLWGISSDTVDRTDQPILVSQAGIDFDHYWDVRMFRVLRASMAIIAGSAAVLAPAFGLGASPTAVAATALSARSAYSPVAAVRDKLPDLVMLPVTTCTREGDEPRCKPFHIDHVNGHEVLRFSTEVANRGEGRMEIVASRPSERVSDLKVVQNIYRSDGSIRHVRTRAVMRYAVQDGHEHFHIRQFEEMRIRPVGSSTSRGKGHKEGFCLSDDWRYDPGSGDHDHYHGCG